MEGLRGTLHSAIADFEVAITSLKQTTPTFTHAMLDAMLEQYRAVCELALYLNSTPFDEV